MKLPRHNTVIAYLALFVALGGSAYAATQLPKNSVGSKQLKSNAVTAAKIKNGAVSGAKIGANTVTGANVDESSLGRVPSAVSAESATAAGHAVTATNATNAGHASHATTADSANSLGGVPGGDFLRTNAVQFHTGALNACFKQKLVEVPGWFAITTVGNCQNQFKVTVNVLAPEAWQFNYDESSATIGTGESTLEFGSRTAVDLFAISTTDTSKHALVDCVYQSLTAPPQISCSTRIPPAA